MPPLMLRDPAEFPARPTESCHLPDSNCTPMAGQTHLMYNLVRPPAGGSAVTQPPPISPRMPPTTVIAIFILSASGVILALIVVGAMMLLRLGQQNQQFDDLTQEQQQQMAGEQQTAIQSVMFQTKAVFQQFASRLEMSSPERKPLGANCDQVTHDLMAIDLSNCPEDFQEKYGALIRAWQDVSAAARRGRGELVVSGGTIFEGMHLDFNWPSGDAGAVTEAVRRFQDACHDLARCAREDGAG